MLDKIAKSFVYEQLDMFKTYYEGYGFCKKILKSIKNPITIRYYDIEEIYGNEVANCVIIQYGGSVKSSNAKDLFEMSDIDGGLIGGASLDANEFSKIVNYDK